MNKSFNIKVYDKNGTTRIKTLRYDPNPKNDRSKEEVLLTAPSFTAKKNGGLGVCKLEFNVKLDDFGDLATVIVPMNEFRIYEVNEAYPLGTLIYSGFLESYEPVIKNGKETVTASLYGYASVLTLDDFRTSGGSTIVQYTGVDPGQMARDIFTRVGELYPQVTFDVADVPLVGFTTNYKFENLTWKDAIDLVQQIAGVSFYWYVDQNNKCHFKEKSSSYDKKYTLGDSLVEVVGKIATDEVKNRVLLKWSGGTITKTDAASITTYGQRTSRVSADSITDSGAADIQAQYILDSSKDAKTSVAIVLNNKASFHEMRPGQTLKIQGLKRDQTVIGDNLQIETISYKADTLSLKLEEARNLADDIKTVAETVQKF